MVGEVRKELCVCLFFGCVCLFLYLQPTLSVIVCSVCHSASKWPKRKASPCTKCSVSGKLPLCVCHDHACVNYMTFPFVVCCQSLNKDFTSFKLNNTTLSSLSLLPFKSVVLRGIGKTLQEDWCIWQQVWQKRMTSLQKMLLLHNRTLVQRGVEIDI